MKQGIPGLFGLAVAGGSARRLGGGDKPLLEVGGRTMLARVVAALAAEASPVAISANGDPARFASFGLPVLNDGDFAGRGPLAGVLAGLEWAARNGGSALLTIPGDTPFTPAGLVAALGSPPACAQSGGQAHYLVALWPVSAGDALRQWLNQRKPEAVQSFAASIGMRPVTFATAGGDPFRNVNTPEDLAAVRAEVYSPSTIRPQK